MIPAGKGPGARVSPEAGGGAGYAVPRMAVREELTGPDLLVPFALDAAGRWLRPGEAADHGRYACPDCRGRAVVRQGRGIIRHFAHFRTSPGCRLAGEGAEHVAAKYTVVAAVQRWREGRALAPVVAMRCATCGALHAECELDPFVADAALEREVSLVAGERACRLDVALLDGEGRLALGVEIRAAHAVPGDKETLLRRARLPWMEIEARQVIADAGARLVPLAGSGTPLSFECEACAGARRAEERRSAALDEAARLAAPRTRFEASLAGRVSWTDRQMESLGRFFPRDRLRRILELLRAAYPRVEFLQTWESRLTLTGALPPAQAGRVVWIAQRRPRGLRKESPLPPPPENAADPRPNQGTLFS